MISFENIPSFLSLTASSTSVKYGGKKNQPNSLINFSHFAKNTETLEHREGQSSTIWKCIEREIHFIEIG